MGVTPWAFEFVCLRLATIVVVWLIIDRALRVQCLVEGYDVTATTCLAGCPTGRHNEATLRIDHLFDADGFRNVAQLLRLNLLQKVFDAAATHAPVLELLHNSPLVRYLGRRP